MQIDLTWHVRATCRGRETDVFYVEERDPTYQDKIRLLRTLCDRCEVIERCRAHALTHEQHGFWAGMTEEERKVEREAQGVVIRSLRTARRR